jgi:hypothetical protein
VLVSELEPYRAGDLMLPGEGGVTDRRDVERRDTERRNVERRDAEDETEAGVDLTQMSRWLQAHWITLAGVLMVAAQTWWMSSLLAHSYFKLDDYYLVEHAHTEGLTWKYLMWVNAGHLIPVCNLIAWILTRISPYNWSLISAVTLGLLACAGLALLRLLRTAFGERPGIVLLLGIYLLSPLGFAGLSWWTVALELLPLQISLFCALNAHLHYLRTGRWWHLAAATAWVLLAMASSDRGLGVPFLLFAITTALYTRGTWRRAVRITGQQYWPAWTLYGLAVLGYVAVYLSQLHTSSQKPGSPGSVTGVLDYFWTMLTNTFVPGMLGGPWRWLAVGDYGEANVPPVFAGIALVVAAAVIMASIWYRLRAWRLWAILAGWIVAVDGVPVLLGRSQDLSARLLGMETRYVFEVPGITVLLIGLAFLPVAGLAVAERAPVARPLVMSRSVTAALVTLITVVFIGSVWSFHAYVAGTTSAPVRSYFTTARLALSEAPAGTVILNTQLPYNILGGLFIGPQGQAADVLTPLITRSSTARFTVTPAGTFDHLMEFDQYGQLVTVVINGSSSHVLSPAKPGGLACWPQTLTGVTVPLQGTPSRPHELRIGYLAASAIPVQVTYAGTTKTLTLERGLHAAYLPVRGSGTDVLITGMARGQLCVGDAEVGVLIPDDNVTAIPAIAAPGF